MTSTASDTRGSGEGEGTGIVKLAPAERKKSTGIADLLAKDSNAPEPGLGLHDAAEKGLVGVIENIFDRTMDLNIDHRDKWDRTALHWAAENGHSEAVSTLIFLGADPFAKDGVGRTGMHLASRAGHLETVKAMVKKVEEAVETDEEKNAERLRLINELDNFSLTPVFLARQRGDEPAMKVFEYLLSHGANYEINKWEDAPQLPPMENHLARQA
mmetsp:Transcript_35795/g.63891  ORF Transcript_35795/g.63891 Transcript_35795/m.63891 type:complete len:214 (-) Transcript_35795:170-811(-)|eukprot:CAMPEP_0177753608 /NCGR_PEP_ID=MMETSP0491_2-20121128/1554_1 /TAXON_ID=63592 /ORGANISM="Tetraselmis chuii, Strain PLY429" /LENGTH=213 /DNA_ID=CAMNT_0019268911 /DNA_START=260 /DNA_END=901 /DNA_ORIENTATION=-